MNLQQMEYIVALDKYRHFVLAAEACGVTQPTLSAMIQKLPNGSLNFCKNKEIGNHIYEAGSIETLIRIVDRNGGYTIIPELHIGFLTDSQKKNILPLQTNPPAQRCVSLLIKDDFIRERAVNAVLDTLKAILPAHMWEGRASKRPIRLRSTPLNTDKNG